MNDLDQYIYQCYADDKPISGVKISKLKEFNREYSNSYLFSKAKNVELPQCPICGGEVSLDKKRNFTVYCGMSCQKKYMSDNNKKNNKSLNKSKSIIYRENIKDSLLEASKYYKNNKLVSIKEVSQKFNISYNSLRMFLSENGLIDKDRQTSVYKQKLKIKFEPIKNKLDDTEFIDKNIKNKNTIQEISIELDCSPNYISKHLRDSGNPYPKHNISSMEKNIRSILDDNGISYICNDRKLLNGLELDLVIPTMKIAIEVNGSYWHQESKMGKNYHLNKTELCENLGFRLIHISDFDFDKSYEVLYSMILNSLHKSTNIYARKCVVSEIDSKTYKNFCDDNHIQKSANSSIKMGLYHNMELVAVMGFSKSRFDKKYDYELIRYCVKRGYSVVGGASKLFKNFINKYDKISIISYCNRSFFTGNLYYKLGMSYSHSTTPNYVWFNTKTGDMKTRYQTQKHKLGTVSTENEEMSSREYYKIYDSGNKVFTYHKGF